MATGIKGVDKVLKNLNKTNREVKKISMASLIECAIVIRRDMSKTSPKVPVDLRNLEHSWFTVTATAASPSPTFVDDDENLMGGHTTVVGAAKSETRQSKTPLLIMGFSANYAAAVHEMLMSVNGNPIKWNRAGSGPKFFEKALTRNEKTLIDILRKNLEAVI